MRGQCRRKRDHWCCVEESKTITKVVIELSLTHILHMPDLNSTNTPVPCFLHIPKQSVRTAGLVLDGLDRQGRGERLLKLLGLGSIVDDKGVQVTGAANLELGLAAVLLDTAGLGVLSASNLEELLNVLDLLRHDWL